VAIACRAIAAAAVALQRCHRTLQRLCGCLEVLLRLPVLPLPGPGSAPHPVHLRVEPLCGRTCFLLL
jgi:hypothetical protein